MTRLHGKVAIVTGGARGIGAAIARRFAGEGARVVIVDVDAVAGEQTAATIEAGGGAAFFVPADVSDAGQVHAFLERTLQAYGRLDILVNNAAIAHGPAMTRHFLETPHEMWRRLLSVHLDGLFFCSQGAAQIMVRQGQGGSIINLSSGGAVQAHRSMMAYDTTKGGIEAATRAMALDLAPWRIRVNALRPGAILVESRIPVGPEASIAPGDIIPWGRLGVAEDLAGPAAFLASDDAEYVTGHVLTVDGGLTAQLRPPGYDTKIEV